MRRKPSAGRASLWLLGLGALVLAAGCIMQSAASQKRAVTRQLFAMDTVMEFTAYGKNAEAALSAAVQEIQRLDALLSAAGPASEVSRLNGDGGGAVSGDTAAFWREHSGFDMVLMTVDRQAFITEGLNSFFETEGPLAVLS